MYGDWRQDQSNNHDDGTGNNRWQNFMENVRTEDTNAETDDDVKEARSEQATHGAGDAPLLNTVDDRRDKGKA